MQSLGNSLWIKISKDSSHQVDHGSSFMVACQPRLLLGTFVAGFNPSMVALPCLLPGLTRARYGILSAALTSSTMKHRQHHQIVQTNLARLSQSSVLGNHGLCFTDPDPVICQLDVLCIYGRNIQVLQYQSKLARCDEAPTCVQCSCHLLLAAAAVPASCAVIACPAGFDQA